MNRRLIHRIALSLSVAAGSIATAQSLTEFSTRATVSVPSGSSIARVALPGPTLAALRRGDGGDLRVFNASGTALPHAVIDASRQVPDTLDVPGVRIVALPIFASTSGTSGGTAPLALRIIEGPTRRVIEVGAAGPPAANLKRELRGLLFDTHQQKGVIRAIELEGTLAPAVIVKATLDASTDLKNWTTLVWQAPVFDFGGDGPTNRRLNLPAGQNLEGQYLRLTWLDAPSLAVTALRTVSAGTVNRAAPVAVEMGAPQSTGRDFAEWTLASGLRANALRLQTSAANTLMPVRLLARSRSGDPWRPVASTVVFRLSGTNGDTVNSAAALPSRLETQVRVEPLRGYSLSGVPLTLALEYPPLEVLFVATGAGPFTVASGSASAAAQSTAVPVTTLLPDYKAGAEFTLTRLTAIMSTNQTPAKPDAATQWSELTLQKSFWLWGVLGLAVVVLAGLAVSLLRSPKASG